MNISGAKLYLAAVLAISLTLRATLGDITPFLSDSVSAFVGWGLGGVSAGISILIGPEIMSAVQTAVNSLAGKPAPTDTTTPSA